MAVTFDGTTSQMTRSVALAGVTDSKLGTFSAWVKLGDDDAANMALFAGGTGSSPGFWVTRAASNKFTVQARNASNTGILTLTSTSTYTYDDNWRHIMASWDLSDTDKSHLYVDNTDVMSQDVFTNDTIDYTKSAWRIGAMFDDTWVFTGEMYDLAFWPGLYLDLSDSDVRKMLRASDAGKPVGYGASGDLGGRQSPAVLFTGAFVKNRGTGGAFSFNEPLVSSRGPSAYRQAALYPTYGERWYDSDRSGFSYPRSRMHRDPDTGQRMGEDERDDIDRDDFRDLIFAQLLWDEEDTRDVEEY